MKIRNVGKIARHFCIDFQMNEVRDILNFRNIRPNLGTNEL